jgi:hypothetical protein
MNLPESVPSMTPQEVLNTKLETWQISFVFYMSEHAGLGKTTTITEMLKMNSDDSLFSGIVARTFKFAYDSGHRVGYDACLEELLG